MAAWLAIAAVMLSSYVNPESRQAQGCQLVCRAANVVSSQG